MAHLSLRDAEVGAYVAVVQNVLTSKQVTLTLSSESSVPAQIQSPVHPSLQLAGRLDEQSARRLSALVVESFLAALPDPSSDEVGPEGADVIDAPVVRVMTVVGLAPERSFTTSGQRQDAVTYPPPIAVDTCVRTGILWYDTTPLPYPMFRSPP